MASLSTRPESVPPEVRSYLEGLVRRTRDVCGAGLAGVYAVGSLALGDYRHGRSDIDVTVVVDPGPAMSAMAALAEELAHPGFACPAAGLELVAYDSDFVARPSDSAGYLLDLNTGPELTSRASFEPADSHAFWYVIDRSVAYQAGLPLCGRPVRAVVAAPEQRTVIAAIKASVREHTEGEGHSADNRVLNGCRSVVFCRTGRWFAKRAAAQMVSTTEPGFRSLVDLALRSFERPRSAALSLPSADVGIFLTWVAECVDRCVAPER